MQRKEELLSRINEVKTILDKMKKRGRCFSFNTPVKFGKARVDEVVLQLMKDCTAFVNDVNKLRQTGKSIRIDYRILWFYKYDIAYHFYKENGHLYVGGKTLGQLLRWKSEQRRKYFNNPHKRKNRPDDNFNFNGEEYKIPLMEAIGMVWDPEQEDWNMYYSLLVEYYKERGHTCLPTHWVQNGLDLGAWCGRIISHKDQLNDERKKQLADVNFPYKNVTIKGTSFWEQALALYVERWYTKDIVQNRIRLGGFQFDVYLDIESEKIAFEYDGYAWHNGKENLIKDNQKDAYCKEHGINLYRIREYGLQETESAKNYFIGKKKFTYSDFDDVMKQIMTDVFGISMLEIDTKKFRTEITARYIDHGLRNFEHLKELLEYKNKNLHWPQKTKEPKLWWTMWRFREAYRGRQGGIYTDEMFQELEKENFPFDPYNEKFERFYSHAERYFKEHGNLNIKHQYVDNYEGEPYRLGDKLAHIKQRHPDVIDSYKVDTGRPLTPNQIERLEAIGIVWLKR